MEPTLVKDCLPVAVRSYSVLQQPLHDTKPQLYAWDSAAFRLRRLGLGAASPDVERQRCSNMESTAKFLSDHQPEKQECRIINWKR